MGEPESYLVNVKVELFLSSNYPEGDLWCFLCFTFAAYQMLINRSYLFEDRKQESIFLCFCNINTISVFIPLSNYAVDQDLCYTGCL